MKEERNCFEFFSRNLASLYDGGRDMTNVDDNCCAVKFIVYRTISSVAKGDFFFDTAFVRSFYTRPIGETDDAHRRESIPAYPPPPPRRIYFI